VIASEKLGSGSGQSGIEEVEERIPSLSSLSLPSPSFAFALALPSPLRSRASQLEGLGSAEIEFGAF